MKTHQELVDSYLDASWALAMEQVAVRQGELAGELEERLEQDPCAAVPRHTVKRCRAAIRKAFAPPAVRRIKVVLARVVIAAVLCGLLATVACAVSPQFREFLNRVFYSIAETFTSFSLKDPKIEDVGALQGEAQEFNGLFLEWLPEGYEYVDGQETERLRRVEFENEDQDYIRIRVTDADESSAYTYDSETDSPTRVQIGEFEGKINKKEDGDTLFWVDNQRNKAIFIFSTHLSQENLLQLAQSLRY